MKSGMKESKETPKMEAEAHPRNFLAKALADKKGLVKGGKAKSLKK
jgi:hypothetical protein